MRLTAGLLALAGLLAPAARDAEDLRAEAAKDLKRYYRERLRRPFIVTDDTPREKAGPPPWEGPLRLLASDEPGERRRAAAYLRELLDLALEHDQSGKAPWRPTPYWGGGADVPARELRGTVAEELAKAKPPAEALPVLRWYFDKEPSGRSLEQVVAALDKVEGKEADTLRAELATAPHPNAAVAAAALHQLAARKQALPAGRLAALCQHHRAAVRGAARKLNARQGGPDPGPFDPAKAVRSEPVRKLMDEVIGLMSELPPAKAELVKVTVRYRDDKGAVKQEYKIPGWLVRKDGDTLEVYTPYGHTETIRHGERKRVEHSEPAPGGGVRYSEIDITVEASAAPLPAEELIQKVEASRKQDTAFSDLSEQGPLTGQFRGSGATLYEAVLGAWLYRAGRDAEAARVLLPALDSLYADRDLVAMVRHRLGEIHGYRMLVAFAGDRDYDRALRHAKLIDERYPGTRFHHYARGLAEQLPRRRDDFTKLKLPTPAAWADLKKKLTREEQIEFLCERMRLLNCFQMMQPGGYDPGDTQYAEACGMKPDASWGLRRGKTEVINPLTELRGPYNWYDRDGKPRPVGMALTLKDVPRLSKYLRDDWYMPTVSFWRDFAPDRHLASTRPQIAEIINGLAGKDVCKVDGWDRLTPAEVDREIERINRWAAANAGKSEVQLQWEALEEALAAGARWLDVDGRVEWLLEKKQDRAYEVMARFLQSDRTEAYHKSEILQAYLKHEVSRAKDLAPKYLDAREPSLRRNAALVVFRTGDKARAREILGDALATDEVEGWHAQAVEALLADGSEESRRQAARLFANRRLPHERQIRPGILRRCAAAGMREPYRFYLPFLDDDRRELPMLDGKGERVGASYFEPSVAASFAREVMKEFAPDDPAVKEIARKFPKEADRIPPLKQWLQSFAAGPED
jgi:hypothetical protein